MPDQLFSKDELEQYFIDFICNTADIYRQLYPNEEPDMKLLSVAVDYLFENDLLSEVVEDNKQQEFINNHCNILSRQLDKDIDFNYLTHVKADATPEEVTQKTNDFKTLLCKTFFCFLYINTLYKQHESQMGSIGNSDSTASTA